MTDLWLLCSNRGTAGFVGLSIRRLLNRPGVTAGLSSCTLLVDDLCEAATLEIIFDFTAFGSSAADLASGTFELCAADSTATCEFLVRRGVELVVGS